MNIYKNHCPVPKTTLNIHQLATNLDILKETTEKSLEEANQKIAEQEDKIQDLRQQLYEQDRIVRLLMSQKDFEEI
jgi:predicted DNA binding protein